MSISIKKSVSLLSKQVRSTYLREGGLYNDLNIQKLTITPLSF